jgi:chromosome segregation ATPase
MGFKKRKTQYMEDTNVDLKVQIESLRKDIENVNNIQTKLDTAIEKLTDVSTSIKSMLAVHEEKISRQEQIDEVIFDKLKERASDINNVYNDLHKNINQVERRLLLEIKSLKQDLTGRVSMLEKWKWLIIGGSIVVGFILSRNLLPLIEMMS